MQKSIIFKIFIVAFIFAGGALFANGNQSVIFKAGMAEIRYQDHLHHEFYWWPQSLLSYQVIFEENVSETELKMTDKNSGKQVPFQFTDWSKNREGKTTAILHLLTDLKPGGSFWYQLQKGVPEKFPAIQAEKKGEEFEIKTDKITTWIPATQMVTSRQLPGPVLSLAMHDKARMGKSVFNHGSKKTGKVETKIVSEGPLFAEAEVNYQFDDGSWFKATVRCVKSYDFIEMKEWMNGFSRDEQASWELIWDNFTPTHRQAPNHPYGAPKQTPGFHRYDWEKVDQNMLNSHHGITMAGNDGKIPFEIGIYGNWPAERTVTSSVFWDEKGMQSVGLFMGNASFWDDKEYSIWSISGKANVRFYYKDGKLRFSYPVNEGQRSTAISCYPHQNDIDYMNELERLSDPKKPYPRTKISQLSYNTFLQNRYGTIALNMLKEWDLTYPAPKRLSPVIFEKEKGTSLSSLERYFHTGGYTNELAISGPCQNSGYAPVPARSFYESYVVQFNTLLPEANEAQREKLVAAFLLHAYTSAGEEYMPMRVMLSGHPNFLADVKGIPALAAFLFPEHQEAKNWSDMFEKYVELNARYHVRPNVNAWDATGGRWTENLGTYTWAALRPTVRTNFLLQDYADGKNRLANENTRLLAASVLHSLSAPFDGEDMEYYRDATGKLDGHSWGVITKQQGPSRIHPPQGAHALRRRPPSVFWRLGKELENYDPLLSENIRFVTRPEHDDMESSEQKKAIYKIMYPVEGQDKGTPPDFQSVKLTGYGIILRAAVGTKDELSVHLQQIDRGPNYRWGNAAEGGCGGIYFYAAGKSYSHNGKEDIGDRRIQDNDLITNFGVFKDGRFKAIGRNELTSPLYDFKVGQFAEITSSKDNGYSWPEYKGRRIMLVGSDYFMVYDDVYNQNMSTRFSWFTHPYEELPEINIVKGGGAGYTASKSKPEFITHTGRETKGIWYDSGGDCMAFVSHKKGYTQESTPYGCIVTSPGGEKDFIFRSDVPVSAEGDGYLFEGTAGFVRIKGNGQKELSMFHGLRIGSSDFVMQTSSSDAGISATFSGSDNIHGEYKSPVESSVTFTLKTSIPDNLSFYLNGIKMPVKSENGKMEVTIPAGKHIWTITTGLPGLPRPVIEYTRNEKGKVFLSTKPVPGASLYRFEYSLDGTTGWTTRKEQAASAVSLVPLRSEAKGYVRIIALNATHQSQPSVVFPLYFTKAKPHFPDGLNLIMKDGKALLTWGKVNGCNEYRLYRKIRGSAKLQLVYKGNGNSFTESLDSAGEIREYAVTAVNGNGESDKSVLIDTDPDNWLNFDPVPGEPFRRVASKWGGNDNTGDKTDFYYPQ